jgi:hypothetical protein
MRVNLLVCLQHAHYAWKNLLIFEVVLHATSVTRPPNSDDLNQLRLLMDVLLTQQRQLVLYNLRVEQLRERVNEVAIIIELGIELLDNLEALPQTCLTLLTHELIHLVLLSCRFICISLSFLLSQVTTESLGHIENGDEHSA